MKAAIKAEPRTIKLSAELIIEPELLPNLIVRCRHLECGRFFAKAKVWIAGCSVCDWHTARCEEHGGEAGARRGVLHHHAHFAGAASEDYGSAHVSSWQAYLKRRDQPVVAKGPLVVLRGGKHR